MNTPRTSWLRRLGLAAVLLIVFVLGWSLRGDAPAGGEAAHTAATPGEAVVWTCSMHPQIRMPEPGQCPICGMDLIPIEPSTGRDAGPRSLSLSPAARTLAEVETTPVMRRATETTLRMVGKIEADERREKEISAWVPGRIDRLYVDYTGTMVRAGEKLFDLYSPELYGAQEELLQAMAASLPLEQSSLESTRRSAGRTVDAARDRLHLWGLTDAQIAAIGERGTPSDHVTIVAPMGGVVMHKDVTEGAYVQTGTSIYAIADLSVLWLMLDVYESDLAWVKAGQTVAFETEAYPGETFTGTISFIDPILDERTRSVKVRVDVPNADGRLKPGMFARAVVHAEVEGAGGTPPLVIPASAPLITGTRAVVYVEDPTETGLYSGREVVLGPRAGDLYVVRRGLDEGERVVSRGSFKIDSALQIQAKPSMMSPASDVVAGVPEAFKRRLDEVVERYVAVSDALSHDDAETATARAAELPAALETANADLLPPVDRAAWQEAHDALAAAARAVAGAGDLEAARVAFVDLSERLIGAVRTFGASGRMPVLVYHCPMYLDNQGADWIQTRTGTKNPYYGSRMLRCGAESETLVEGPAAADDREP